MKESWNENGRKTIETERLKRKKNRLNEWLKYNEKIKTDRKIYRHKQFKMKEKRQLNKYRMIEKKEGQGK